MGETLIQGIRRTGPPQATQRIREDLFAVHVPLSEPPSADWKRLFYDAQRGAPEDFPPRAVEISGASLRFRSDAASIAARLGWIEKWIARANEKEAALGPRTEEDRRRREEHAREQQELAELNARLAGL
jgi:hypothetical protein